MHAACAQWFKHVARQNKRDKDNTAQRLADSLRHFTCLFVCCEKKVRARSSENLWVFDLRVLQVYSSASPLRLGPQRVGLAFASVAASGCKPEFSHRSANALLAITKGFVRPQVESLGFDEDRIIQTTLTIYDPILQSKESRAVTLTNLAMNPCDFFELTVTGKIIKISETSRHAILAEIRKSDLDEHLWNSYGTIDAFESNIENCLRQVSQLDKCVQYRSSEKNGYLCKRIQVPDDSRDDLYKLSGKCGIQFRAIRVHDSPPESGLEVLRLPPTKLPMPKEVEKISRCPGYLGLFRTQNGTFVRVMDTNIADARLFLYGEVDLRFTPFNRGIKCLLSYRTRVFVAGHCSRKSLRLGKA